MGGPSPALCAHEMGRAGAANGIIVRSISSELWSSPRAPVLRPASGLCADAARGRYNAARSNLLHQRSVPHQYRAAAANGSR